MKSVSLEAEPGTVLGLVGENGAGKSTLIKIVSGAIVSRSRQRPLDGRPIAPRNTHEALALGIASVFQELTLVRDLTVEQNLLLTARRDALAQHRPPPRSQGRGRDSRPARARHRARAPASATCRSASQQMLEIVRAVERNPRVLLLDEATSALGASRGRMARRLVARLRAGGAIVLFISHRWDEIVAFLQSRRGAAQRRARRGRRHQRRCPKDEAVG